MYGLPARTLRRFSHDADLRKVLGLLSTQKRTAPAIDQVQSGWCPLYPKHSRQPYVPATAHGPWIGTTDGNVVYDAGGYGMLGWGHNPPWLKDVLAKDQVQANIMTPSLSQPRFVRALWDSIGGSPYTAVAALNSGSEAVSFALRCARSEASDTKPEAFVRMSGSFHGRTDLPAALSASCDEQYRAAIPCWGVSTPRVETVPFNDVEAVRPCFERLRAAGYGVRAAIAEPVQGEGSPGNAMTRAFYDELRACVRDFGGHLIIDSIQAGLRADGCLSVVDYDAMLGVDPPDVEIFSKAIHAGQYPLSVVAMGPRVAYPGGIYGNTMTANPRALDVGAAVLARCDQQLRRQIQANGARFLEGLRSVQASHRSVVTNVTGTGLLCALELDPAVDVHRVEAACRNHGLNVIHGGSNALRFTPRFEITAEEIEYCVVATLDRVLKRLRYDENLYRVVP